MTAVLGELMKALETRDEWARKGIALAEAGKIRQARAAQRQAEKWDMAARVIEGRYRVSGPRQ